MSHDATPPFFWVSAAVAHSVTPDVPFPRLQLLLHTRLHLFGLRALCAPMTRCSRHYLANKLLGKQW